MTTDTGTDARRHNFFIIDNEAVDNYDLNPYEGWLYVIILRHINHGTGIAFPSLATLAKETKMSEPTVVKYLKSLVTKKLITIDGQYDKTTKTNKPNHYTAMGVVKEVNQGGKADLPGVVKEINTNNTKGKKTNNEKKDQRIPAEPVKKLSDHQLMVGAISLALGINPDYLTKKRAGTIGSAASQIRTAKGKPEHIPEFVEWLKARAKEKRWDDFSEHAMAKYWGDYATQVLFAEAIHPQVVHPAEWRIKAGLCPGYDPVTLEPINGS